MVLTSAVSIASSLYSRGKPLIKHLRYWAVVAQVSAGKEKGNNSSGLSNYCFLFHLGERLKDMPREK